MTPIESGIDADWLRDSAPDLARDIVARIDSASNLATSYGLSPDQWEALRASEHFRAMVTRAVSDLSGPTGTAEIARRKAALAIEQGGVLDMAEIMGNRTLMPGPRIAAYNALMETAQMGKASQVTANASNPTGAGGPLIIINIPNMPQMSVGTIVPPTRVIEAETAE